jgi:hypothetical protein
MIDMLIAFIHLLIILFTNFYVFFTKNKEYDYIYYFLLLHWTFLNGECICSYYFKKIQNNDYELGSDFKNDDLYYIFGEYRSYIIIFINIMIPLNIFIVTMRNNKKVNYIIYTLIFLFLTFSLNFYNYTDHHINKQFQYSNNIIQISLIFFGLYVYTNKYNINQT